MAGFLWYNEAMKNRIENSLPTIFAGYNFNPEERNLRMELFKCEERHGEKVLVLEWDEASQLDKRLWDVTLAAADDETITPEEVITSPEGYEVATASIKCEHCGSYVPHNTDGCNRVQHVRFDVLHQVE
jgi:hypothetical protein